MLLNNKVFIIQGETMAKKKMKGKQWYDIVAPKDFGGKVIGEALITDPNEAENRSMVVNYTHLNGHPSKYYVKIKLMADEVEENRIRMKYVGHECQRDYMYQMVRKRSMKIDNRMITETKDGKKVIIKTMGISLRKTNTSIKSHIRKTVEKVIKKKVGEMKLKELIKSVLNDRLQKGTRKEVNKVYPLTRFEVRKMEIVEEKKE